MVVLTSIVTQDYLNEVVDNAGDSIKTLNEIPHQVYVLTDVHNSIGKLLPKSKTITYPRCIWSYADKIYYTFKLSLQLNEDVIWVDGDKAHLHENFLEGGFDKSRLFMSDFWGHNGVLFKIEYNHIYWQPLYKYAQRHKVDIYDILLPLENFFYVPKGISNMEILKEIEVLKVLLDYQSIIDEFPFINQYTGNVRLGNGEGAILGYLIKKYNIEYTFPEWIII